MISHVQGAPVYDILYTGCASLRYLIDRELQWNGKKVYSYWAGKKSVLGQHKWQIINDALTFEQKSWKITEIMKHDTNHED